MTGPALRGLYVITDPNLIAPGALTEQVGAALRGGARIVQYRDKGTDPARRQREAADLVALCREHGALLILNDDVELARTVGADGVHLGREDLSLEQARARLGPGRIIGVSCYDEPERAERAAAASADYVAFGRFFPSRTKPQAVQASPELLIRARAALDVPVAAIGGITPENGKALIDAGADMLAVIHGVFGQEAVEQAARRFADLFR